MVGTNKSCGLLCGTQTTQDKSVGAPLVLDCTHNKAIFIAEVSDHLRCTTL